MTVVLLPNDISFHLESMVMIIEFVIMFVATLVIVDKKSKAKKSL